MNDKPASTDTNKDAPGALLKAARKAAGLSVEEIASKMNLTLEIILEIEADDYQRKLSPAFYRGYFRTYAQIIGLEPEDLISLFNRRINQGSLSNKIIPTFDTDLHTKRDRNLPVFKWFLIFAMITVLSIVAYFTLTYRSSNEDGKQVEISLASDSESSSLSLDLSIVDEIESDAASVEHDALILDETKTEPLVKDETVLLEKAKLTMTFSGDCWVKITDHLDQVLAIGIKRNGKIMELDGNAPFHIILGNASVVEIRYNQQLVDLSSFPSGNRVAIELSSASEYLQ